MGFLDIEGPFMRLLDRVINLLWLNVIMIVFCLPVFTIGASFTAMHYVIFKMLHNEEGYIFRDFYKAFKENFKAATKIWLVLLAVGAFLGLDIYFIYKGSVTLPQYYKMGIYILFFMVLLGFVYIFPVLSHYENTMKNTLKNSYAMAMDGFIKSIVMVALLVAPWLGAAFIPNFIFICLFYGITLPAYLSATLYEGSFKKFERAQERALEAAAEEEAEEARQDADKKDDKN